MPPSRRGYRLRRHLECKVLSAGVVVQKQSRLHTSRAESLIGEGKKQREGKVSVPFFFSFHFSLWPWETIHCTCSATKTMPWLLCYVFGTSHLIVKLIFVHKTEQFKARNYGVFWTCLKEGLIHAWRDGFFYLGEDQRAKESWKRLVSDQA